MRIIRLATLLASLTVGAASLKAQQTVPTTTSAPHKPNPVRDSLRAVRKDLKQHVAERRAAKAAGDTAKMRVIGRNIRLEKKQAMALRGRLPRHKGIRRRKP